MKLSFFKIIFIFYLISPTYTYSIEQPVFKNLVIHKKPKKLDFIEFKNIENKQYTLSKFENKLVILNFWATWCAPCRDEMPSLDRLKSRKDFNNLHVIPINIGREELLKSIEFFKQINIKNLDIYYDDKMILPKKLMLRGVPTSIIVNKNGEEVARIIGSANFDDKKFINWLKKFD